MQASYEFLQRIGLQSLDVFWFPLLIWTIIALLIFLGFRAFSRLSPIYHYHLRAATLAAIPFGLISTFMFQCIRTFFISSESFNPAIFIVETPQTFYLPTIVQDAEFKPNWFEPGFLLGVGTTLILLVSLILLVQLVVSYFRLKKFHTSISKSNLSDISTFNCSEYSKIKLSFHEHPLVPFTFGWKSPIIVLPKSIYDDPKKVRMAIQHELVHIQRRDYLLQLILSVIESIFWFHPLIHLGSREIEMYREISCDQQVLNISGVSVKEYASMLYELLPLNRGLSSFSINMAVQQSTLKKRIETMKYHKLHNASLKRSLLFLSLMITVITIPIACSDMRAPQNLSPEELENITLELSSPNIEINGIIISNAETKSLINTSGLGAILLNAKEYGIFKIAPRNFENGTMAGEISGNEIKFSINELNVKIHADSKVLSKFDDIPIWVEHINIDTKIFSIGSLANANLDTPPPPPYQKGTLIDDVSNKLPPPSPVKITTFRVVEVMPKLIGGISSIQSKVQYPELAKREGIEGRVIVQFIVNKNGDVENPEIIRGIGGGCDEAAIEAVRLAKFKPGIQRGQPVQVQYNIPIVFKLSDTHG